MYLTIKQFILLTFLLCCFEITIAQKQTQKVKDYYTNGIIKMKGKKINNAKIGTWFYYANNGKLTKKERWKNGDLKFTILYNEKVKASEIIYKDGTVKKLKGCGC
jgi:antitoxin component YwqK of YwqJK toxin-antitoxin module